MGKYVSKPDTPESTTQWGSTYQHMTQPKNVTMMGNYVYQNLTHANYVTMTGEYI